MSGVDRASAKVRFSKLQCHLHAQGSRFGRRARGQSFAHVALPLSAPPLRYLLRAHLRRGRARVRAARFLVLLRLISARNRRVASALPGARLASPELSPLVQTTKNFQFSAHLPHVPLVRYEVGRPPP